jgi:hypothetical protein
MAQTQSLGNPQITGQTLEDLQRSTQFWMQQVFNHLDRMTGLRGTPKLYNNLDANGMTLQNIGNGVNPTDAVARQQTLVLTMDPQNGIPQFDAQGIGIFNAANADHSTDLVTLQQLIQTINDSITNAGMGASFVTVNAEPLLTNERQAAVEATVLTLTDGGAGSTLTWAVAANGITNAKLRQGAATSIMGRSANSVGNVADIAASADGQILVRQAAALTFTATPTITGPVIIGTDPGGANTLRIGGALTINSATMISTKTSFTNGAAAAAGTLLNAPAAGNPTKWIPVDDNGTTRYIPAW